MNRGGGAGRRRRYGAMTARSKLPDRDHPSPPSHSAVPAASSARSTMKQGNQPMTARAAAPPPHAPPPSGCTGEPDPAEPARLVRRPSRGSASPRFARSLRRRGAAVSTGACWSSRGSQPPRRVGAPRSPRSWGNGATRLGVDDPEMSRWTSATRRTSPERCGGESCSCEGAGMGTRRLRPATGPRTASGPASARPRGCAPPIGRRGRAPRRRARGAHQRRHRRGGRSRRLVSAPACSSTRAEPAS